MKPLHGSICSAALGTILLVEDDADDRVLFCHAVDKSGLNVRVAQVGHGEEAIAYLEGVGAFADREQFPLPNMMVLDLAMPVMNGLELLRWLRDSPRWRELPVLVLTGGADPEWERTARALGAVRFLEKSVRLEDLAILLEEIAARLPVPEPGARLRLLASTPWCPKSKAA